MACRVCRACKLSYENSQDYNPCPICASETVYVADGQPDEDIDVAVKAAMHLSSGQRKVLLWRRRTLVSLGYGEAMLEVLAESPVDLHELQDLIVAGCPLETAANILL